MRACMSTKLVNSRAGHSQITATSLGRAWSSASARLALTCDSSYHWPHEWHDKSPLHYESPAFFAHTHRGTVHMHAHTRRDATHTLTQI